MWYIAFEFKYEINRELRRKAQEPCEDKFSKTFKWGNYTGTLNKYKSNIKQQQQQHTHQKRYEIYNNKRE